MVDATVAQRHKTVRLYRTIVERQTKRASLPTHERKHGT